MQKGDGKRPSSIQRKVSRAKAYLQPRFETLEMKTSRVFTQALDKALEPILTKILQVCARLLGSKIEHRRDLDAALNSLEKEISSQTGLRKDSLQKQFDDVLHGEKAESIREKATIHAKAVLRRRLERRFQRLLSSGSVDLHHLEADPRFFERLAERELTRNSHRALCEILGEDKPSVVEVAELYYKGAAEVLKRQGSSTASVHRAHVAHLCQYLDVSHPNYEEAVFLLFTVIDPSSLRAQDIVSKLAKVPNQKIAELFMKHALKDAFSTWEDDPNEARSSHLYEMIENLKPMHKYIGEHYNWSVEDHKALLSRCSPDVHMSPEDKELLERMRYFTDEIIGAAFIQETAEESLRLLQSSSSTLRHFAAALETEAPGRFQTPVHVVLEHLVRKEIIQHFHLSHAQYRQLETTLAVEPLLQDLTSLGNLSLVDIEGDEVFASRLQGAELEAAILQLEERENKWLRMGNLSANRKASRKIQNKLAEIREKLYNLRRLKEGADPRELKLSFCIEQPKRSHDIALLSSSQIDEFNSSYEDHSKELRDLAAFLAGPLDLVSCPSSLDTISFGYAKSHFAQAEGIRRMLYPYQEPISADVESTRVGIPFSQLSYDLALRAYASLEGGSEEEQFLSAMLSQWDTRDEVNPEMYLRTCPVPSHCFGPIELRDPIMRSILAKAYVVQLRLGSDELQNLRDRAKEREDLLKRRPEQRRYLNESYVMQPLNSVDFEEMSDAFMRRELALGVEDSKARSRMEALLESNEEKKEGLLDDFGFASYIMDERWVSVDMVLEEDAVELPETNRTREVPFPDQLASVSKRHEHILQTLSPGSFPIERLAAIPVTKSNYPLVLDLWKRLLESSSALGEEGVFLREEIFLAIQNQDSSLLPQEDRLEFYSLLDRDLASPTELPQKGRLQGIQSEVVGDLNGESVRFSKEEMQGLRALNKVVSGSCSQLEKVQVLSFLNRARGDMDLNKRLSFCLEEKVFPLGVGEETVALMRVYTYQSTRLEEIPLVFDRLEQLMDAYERGEEIAPEKRLTLGELGLIEHKMVLRLGELFEALESAGVLGSIHGLNPLQEAGKRWKKWPYLKQRMDARMREEQKYSPGDIMIEVSTKNVRYYGRERQAIDIAKDLLITPYGHTAVLYQDCELEELRVSHQRESYNNESMSLGQVAISDVFHVDIFPLLGDDAKAVFQDTFGEYWQDHILTEYQEIQSRVHADMATRMKLHNNDELQKRAGLANFKLRGHKFKVKQESFSQVLDDFYNPSASPVDMICSEFVGRSLIATLLLFNEKLQKDLALEEPPFEIPFSLDENLALLDPGRLKRELEKAKAVKPCPPPPMLTALVR